MNETGIEILNVTKEYITRGVKKNALKDISLTVRPGEYIGLMGLNGSGKSTLARLINGLIMPTGGQVYIDGMDTADSSKIMEIRRRTGMIFQNPDNQLVCPVIEEEIAFGPENLGLPLPEIHRRIEWALETVGLTDLKYHAPQLLSGGQKQKVALASVLAMLPDYLILDEPFSMLDNLSRQELLAQLNILNREKGMTIILCSHNPDDLIWATRLIVIDQGSVYLQGKPREVYAQKDQLAAIGMEPPGVYQIINWLEKEGHEAAGDIRTMAGLVDAICLK
jgi:energy-coupling factor transport system ATP-binding protein